MERKNSILVFAKEVEGGSVPAFENLNILNKKNFIIRYFFFRKVRKLNFNKNVNYFNSAYTTNKKISFKNFYLFFKDINCCYRVLSAETPDAVISLNLYSSATLLLTKFLLRKNIPIISLVNNDIYKETSLKKFLLYRFLVFKTGKFTFSNLDAIIFTTKDLEVNQKRKFDIKCKTTVIYGGINTARVKKLAGQKISHSEKEIFQSKGLNIFAVGRLESQKDYPTIIKAFAISLKKNPKSKLVIIGDGSLKKDLIKLSQSLEISKNILFLGWRNNIFAYLKYADLFVFSSYYEGLPYVIFEAMTLGIPIITTDTPFGLSEAIQNNKFGILVKVGDYKTMAEKISLILRNKVLRKKYSNLSYQRSKSFTIDIYLKKMEQFLIKIINRSQHQQ